ncbi:phosphopantetheine-binding protein [Paracoccus sulfuroxidans]|uniref:Bifunctional isochorismate lyase/aryl carrier protein/2,3-dihydroxybenzoate-AMP ligase n=1 Tax=Paracoccus sulfuroxidans TaxID=384678 RepID=A0A562NH79_9RHOB|nr:phosphopantetheine-binding protein [Paracoccus sulfuroxidans]TWI31271.1 bifunctional isochorismate lyase/aryl carrier protein/2,3-dihydroxybenzoate-AMP ligase [Paracoccus sulfuroxidans]
MSDALLTESATVLDPAQITRDWLEARVSKMIDDEEEIDPEENLLLYGLDSISVMQLISDLRGAGVGLSFAELGQQPTLNKWWNLIAAKLPR